MRLRAVHVLVPIVVIAVSGCGLLKKKKKTFNNDDPSSDPGTTATAEPPATNRADLTRFADEVLLHGQPDFVRQITFAKTAPDDGGTTVGVIDPDTPVLKWSLRSGNTLITFDRAAFPGKKFAGWVNNAAFTTTVAAGSTATGTAPKPTATATATATGVVAGTASAAPTGTCTLSLRSTSFSPSTATCSFNEKVRSGGPATLTFPCAGGAATARFSSQTFIGTADKTHVDITNSAPFTFRTCQVTSTQRITGTPPNLSYSYSERTTGGDCAKVSTCTASGRVSAL